VTVKSSRTLAWVMLLAMVMLFAAQMGAQETAADIAARAQAAPVNQQPELYIKAAQQHLKAANQLYEAGKVDEASAAVKEVVEYADKAAEACTRSRRRLKNTEIDLRRMAEKLRAIHRTLNFDDQAPVQAAADHLEDLRTKLLALMFGKEKK
jgi:hypothetical protein